MMHESEQLLTMLFHSAAFKKLFGTKLTQQLFAALIYSAAFGKLFSTNDSK